MSQDKYIKKHQDFLEKMRDEVRSEKDSIIDKMDINKLLKDPKSYLRKVAFDYYESKEDLLKESIGSGKRLAKSILKGLNGKAKR